MQQRKPMITTQSLREDVCRACHAIVKQGLDSGPFGNISIRVPGTDQFWVNPEGKVFNQLTPDDIVLIDVAGNLISGNNQSHPGAFIHREIYRLRADIQAIVHTHSEYTVAVSLLGCVIEPYTQLGAAMYNDQGVYLGFTGPVRTTDEGVAIAEALADKSFVIAKNHGLFATGTSIQAALWDMVVAEMAAKVHVTAKQLGLPKADVLPDEFMQKSRIEVRDRQHGFMWEALVRG